MKQNNTDLKNAFPFTDAFSKATREVYGEEGAKNLLENYDRDTITRDFLGRINEDGYTITQRLQFIFEEVRPEITRINQLNECTVFNPVATEMLEDLQNIINELKTGEQK